MNIQLRQNIVFLSVVAAFSKQENITSIFWKINAVLHLKISFGFRINCVREDGILKSSSNLQQKKKNGVTRPKSGYTIFLTFTALSAPGISFILFISENQKSRKASQCNGRGCRYNPFPPFHMYPPFFSSYDVPSLFSDILSITHGYKYLSKK